MDTCSWRSRPPGSHRGSVAVTVLVVWLMLLFANVAVAGGGEEPVQSARPNAPVQLPIVVVDDGGTSVGEWAALATGIAALLGALEAFRRRRHRAPE